MKDATKINKLHRCSIDSKFMGQMKARSPASAASLQVEHEGEFYNVNIWLNWLPDLEFHDCLQARAFPLFPPAWAPDTTDRPPGCWSQPAHPDLGELSVPPCVNDTAKT